MDVTLGYTMRGCDIRMHYEGVCDTRMHCEGHSTNFNQLKNELLSLFYQVESKNRHEELSAKI